MSKSATSRDEHGNTPDTDVDESQLRRPLTSATIDLHRYTFSEGKEISDTMAAKLEKALQMPEKPGRRLIELVGNFNDFPWTQYTIMAAWQLPEVLMMFLQRHIGVSGEKLHA